MSLRLHVELSYKNILWLLSHELYTVNKVKLFQFLAGRLHYELVVTVSLGDLSILGEQGAWFRHEALTAE